MAPFGQHRHIRGAAAEVTTHGKRAESAPVVALPAGDDASARRFAALDEILPRELNRSLGGFRAARSEVDAPASAKRPRGQLEQAGSQALRDAGVELGSVREGELLCLLGHGAANRGNAVADAHYSGSARHIQIFFSINGEDVAPLTANSLGIILAKAARKKRLAHDAATLCANSSRTTRSSSSLGGSVWVNCEAARRGQPVFSCT